LCGFLNDSKPKYKNGTTNYQREHQGQAKLRAAGEFVRQ
jgi:hypothetical protein